MPNSFAALQASREAEGRRRMTHWAPQDFQPPTLGQALDAAALATIPVPVLGDVVGFGADAYDWMQNPDSRTVGNALLVGAGLLPFVPPVAAAGRQAGNAVLDAMTTVPGSPRSQVGAVGPRGHSAIGATQNELETAQRNATEMLGLPANNTQADRARALANVDDPLWRGGKPPSEAGEMGNQNWFSRDEKTAQGHASREPGNELGKYVMLQSAERFPANQPWALRHDDAIGIGEALRKDGYTDLAGYFEKVAVNEDTTLALAAKALETWTGEAGMRKYLGGIGFNALDFGRDVAVTRWNKGVMRDPKRAAFDPARLGDPSIYAGIAGLGALPLLRQEQSSGEY